MAYLAGLGLSSGLRVQTQQTGVAPQNPPRISRQMLADAAGVAGGPLKDAELDAIVDRVNENLRIYAGLHALHLDNSVSPPLYFNPVLPGMAIDRTLRPLRRSTRDHVKRPDSNDDVGFLPVTELSELIRTRRISSLELTQIYLERLNRYG